MRTNHGTRWRGLAAGILRYNRVLNRACFVAAAAFLAACSKPGSENPPPLPKLQIERFKPQIRARIEEAYRAALARPDDAAANGGLGMLLQAFEQLESAEACYRRARAFDPGRFDWAYYLGLVQSQNGENAEAAKNLAGAIRIDPGYVPAKIKLAEVLLILGRLEESRQISEALVREDPRIAPAYYWLGRAAAARGDLRQAEQWYAQACEQWPSYGTAHYALALAYQKTGQTAEAQQHMSAYQKYQANGDPQPEDPKLEAVRALDNSAIAHLMRAVDLENAGQLRQAIAEDEEAARQDPNLVQAQANLISLYARAGEPEKAEQAYRAVLAVNPNLPQSHYDYGVFLVSRARFAEAEAAFRKAIESSPHYAEAHSNLGAMLERRGRMNEAAREYRAAIEDKPNFRQAHYQLGRLLLMDHKPAQAIEELRQTLEPSDEATPQFLYALGVACAEVHDFASARDYLRRGASQAQALGQDELASRIQGVLGRLEQSGGK
jgi:tetratricopeptide (TPR) repeat protein